MFQTKSLQIELYSFDIFDTLITRRVGVPKGIFAIMQEIIKGKINLSKDFYTIRIESERLARKNEKSREITFDEIYLRMQSDYNLSNETINFLKKLEIEVELKNIVGIDENIIKVKSLIQQGKKVILISDMYHNKDTIRLFLTHIDSIFENLEIYVSSQYRASKWEGKLYRIIQEKEKVNFKKWLHVGDNKISDINKAKKLKIKTRYFEFSPLTKYEEELLELSLTNIYYQFIVGASRLVRLNKNKNKKKYDFGASFCAPILYNYINWIIEETLKIGKDQTLHFIARDGYIPKIIADMIIKKRGLDIKTKYIYGSRLAWRIPNENNFKEFIYMMMNEYPHNFTLKLFAQRLQLDLSELNKYLKIKNPNKLLSCKERVEISNKILNNKEIKQFILESNSKNRNLIIEYIKQEFDLSQRPLLFVDISGSGNTQNILCDYINQIQSNTEIYTFFLTSTAPQKENPNSKRFTYCIKPKANYHYFELITRANSGQTLGYQNQKGKIEPILEEGYKNKIEEWGIDDYIKGCVDFVQNILECESNYTDVEVCYLYHDYMTCKCSIDNAKILGDIPFSNVGKEQKVKKAADKISLLNIIKIFVFKDNVIKYSEFPQLSYIRSNFISNILVFIARRFNLFSEFYCEMKLLSQINKTKNNTVLLWGASLFLEDFLKKYCIKNKNILGVIDKNPVRIGEKIGGYEIISPDAIKNFQPEFILTTVKNRNRTIFYQVSNFLQENEIDAVLLPNIFEI